MITGLSETKQEDEDVGVVLHYFAYEDRLIAGEIPKDHNNI